MSTGRIGTENTPGSIEREYYWQCRQISYPSKYSFRACTGAMWLLGWGLMFRDRQRDYILGYFTFPPIQRLRYTRSPTAHIATINATFIWSEWCRWSVGILPGLHEWDTLSNEEFFRWQQFRRRLSPWEIPFWDEAKKLFEKNFSHNIISWVTLFLVKII